MGQAIAQSSLPSYTLSIISIDTSNFPDMSAEFVVLDDRGNIVRDLDTAVLHAFENGIAVNGATFTIECPPDDVDSAVHAVLVADRSGSMSLPTPSGTARITVLKRGATAFVRAVRFNGHTDVGLTAFDDLAILLTTFSTSPNYLATLIDQLTLGSGTNYVPAFLDESVGAIPMLERLPADGAKRAMVFLTDGVPNERPPVDSIVRRANAAGIDVYCITIGLPMTQDLRDIAERTGGAWYGGVDDEEHIRAVYTAIALRVQGRKPCRVRWRSGYGCGPNSMLRQFRLVDSLHAAAATMPYTAPERSVIGLATVPEYVWFGTIAPPSIGQYTVKLFARGGQVTVDSITFGDPLRFGVLDWGGPAPPFTLQEGESRSVQLWFKPTDSTVASSQMQPHTRPCPAFPVTVSGGLYGARYANILTLVTPRGGESYLGCDPVTIQWQGVPPTEAVKLEYSADGGATWKLIIGSVTGLRYVWEPPGSGTQYKVRVTTNRIALPDSMGLVAGGGGLDQDGIDAQSALLLAPADVALDGTMLYIAESGHHRVRRVDLSNGIISTVAGTGASGYTGDGGPGGSARLNRPMGLTLHAGSLYIADYGNHVVRRLNLASNTITTFAGTGGSGFSGDSGIATNAELQFPVSVAANNSGLFISDQGNNRIRFVDFATSTIRTFAGGGWATGGDGLRATEVILKSPAGLTVATDPRRVSDSLMIAEEGSHRVRIVELRSTIISTLAGTGYVGYDGDNKDARDVRMSAPRAITIGADQFYISDAGNNRIRSVARPSNVIRTIAGNGRAGYDGNGGPATLAQINGPGGLAATATRVYFADMFNDRVRVVALSEIGRSDSSRSAFSIAVGRVGIPPAMKVIDFGGISLGAGRDTAVAGAICNIGTLPMQVDSIVVVGPDSADFSVVSGATGAPLAAGSCTPVELRFAPLALGARAARAIVYGRCAGTDTFLLAGQGVPACGFTVLDRADLGASVRGVARDSVITAAICNTGTSRLDLRVAIVPADGPFALVAGGGTRSLAPGECHTITVRFTPAEGDASAYVDYGIPAACGNARTVLLGRGLAPARLVAPGLSIAIGPCGIAWRDTTLPIANAGDAPLVITGLSLLNNNEGFALIAPPPTASAPLVVAPGSTTLIALRFAPASRGAKSAVLRVISNDAGSPTDLALGGRSDTIALAAAPTPLVFDGTLPAAAYPIDSVITLHNNGTLPIQVDSAWLAGPDSARFQVVPGALPATIAPGDSARITVRVLGPAGDSARAALLRFATAPACDSTVPTIPVIERGRLAAIAVDDLSMAPLRCGTQADTVIVVRNTGGAPLTISGARLVAPGTSAFQILETFPVVIPPGGTAGIRVRFAPPGPGAHAATLLLEGNASSGDSVANLVGAMLGIAVTTVPPDIAMGPVSVGVTAGGFTVLTNTGTAPLLVRAMLGATFATVTPSTPFALAPGASIRLDVSGAANTPGAWHDTLRLVDVECGELAAVPVVLRVAPAARATVMLPYDSAAAGTHVRLPIGISLADRDAFRLSGATAWTATIDYNGLLLVADSASGATIIGRTFDSLVGTERIRLSGRYTGGDTLALLACTVPASAAGTTPLRFLSFLWDVPAVATDSIDGQFSTYGCRSMGELRARITMLKVWPMPARDAAVAEFELQSETAVRLTLVDGAGRRVLNVIAGRYAAGRHTVALELGALPTGTYALVASTAAGAVAEPVVVVR